MMAQYDLKGAKVLVIGTRIVRQLVGLGCREIIVIDNMIRGRPENLAGVDPSMVLLVQGDIRDRELVEHLIAGTDTVFHQAALRITHCAAAPRQAMEVMVDGTFELVEACRLAGVRKLVYASAYGMADSLPTAEPRHAQNNRTLYGVAKVFGEGLLRSYNEMFGFDYTALRTFNVYGPGMDIHGVYSEVLIRWMDRLARGEPPLIFGDGLQTMNFIHVDDVARANILAATMPAKDRVLNIGASVETSLHDLAFQLASVMGRPDLVPVHVGDSPANPVRRHLADVSAASEVLGFTSRIALHDGLHDLVSWWLAEKRLALSEAML